MNWDCRLSQQAVKQLRRLPRDRQEQIREALDGMRHDPLSGDVLPIKSGRLRGTLRRRVGRYRIIFVLDPSERSIEVAAILPRTGGTYR